MATFYVTFGTNYAREPHPVLGMRPELPNGWWEVEAPTEWQAREYINELIGNAFSSIYPAGGAGQDQRWFPLGALPVDDWLTPPEPETPAEASPATIDGIPVTTIEKVMRALYEYEELDFPYESLSEQDLGWLKHQTLAALVAVYAEMHADALDQAARDIDLRKVALTPECDVDALDYDTTVDYGTDLAQWWLADQARKLRDTTPTN